MSDLLYIDEDYIDQSFYEAVILAAADLSAAFTLTAQPFDPVEPVEASAELQANFAVAAVLSRVVEASAELNLQFNTAITAEKVFAAEAEFAAVFGLSAALTNFVITQYVYRIPAENRTIRIRR